MELRQEVYEEAIRVYKRYAACSEFLLIVREDCRFHGNATLDLLLIDLADTTQELYRLFSTAKTENDIRSLQQGTLLDDSLPDVQAFLKSRSMLMQLLM